MLGLTTLKQIVVYVPSDIYDEFKTIKATDRRLSFSAIGEKAIRIALPELRKEYASFNSPAQGAPGQRRRRRKAA